MSNENCDCNNCRTPPIYGYAEHVWAWERDFLMRDDWTPTQIAWAHTWYEEED